MAGENRNIDKLTVRIAIAAFGGTVIFIAEKVSSLLRIVGFSKETIGIITIILQITGVLIILCSIVVLIPIQREYVLTLFKSLGSIRDNLITYSLKLFRFSQTLFKIILKRSILKILKLASIDYEIIENRLEISENKIIQIKSQLDLLKEPQLLDNMSIEILSFIEEKNMTTEEIFRNLHLSDEDRVREILLRLIALQMIMRYLPQNSGGKIGWQLTDSGRQILFYYN